MEQTLLWSALNFASIIRVSEKQRCAVIRTHETNNISSECASRFRAFFYSGCAALCLTQFAVAKPESVQGVVYMGSGSMIGDVLANKDLPALVLRGSRDPFCPKEVNKSPEKSPFVCFDNSRG